MAGIDVIKDTIQCDTTVLQRFVRDPDYYYDREILPKVEQTVEDSGGDSWFERFIDWLMRKLGDTPDIDTPELGDTSVGRVVLTIIAIVVVLLALYLLFRYLRNSKMLFWREKDKGDLDYELEEDTIYGIDFDADIKEALARGDYRAAVRLIYLKTLRHLNDAGRIVWTPHTTPSQYSRDLGDPQFTELTNSYIRVRYGGHSATSELCDHLGALRESITGSEEGGDK